MTQVEGAALGDLEREELPALARLHRAAFPDEVDDERVLCTRFADELRRPWARVRVLRAGSELLGYCLSWTIEDELHLHTIAVDPRAQRQGFGRLLLGDLLQRAREGGSRLVLLELRADNAPALALYRAHGFEQDRVRRGYYRDGMDALEMSLVLLRSLQ